MESVGVLGLGRIGVGVIVGYGFFCIFITWHFYVVIAVLPIEDCLASTFRNAMPQIIDIVAMWNLLNVNRIF